MVRVEGDLNATGMRAISEAARDRSAAEGMDRFLFDLRAARNVESISASYQYAYRDMPAMQISRSARSAVLVSPGDHSHDFMETLCRNAGYNVSIFTNANEAVAWLNSPD